jgi:hypothetical protein
MNRYLCYDISEYTVLYERVHNPKYYKNLVLKIVNQMSQISVQNNNGKHLILQITYVHFRFFGDCRKYTFRALNIVDAYRQYLDMSDRNNSLEMTLYINYHLDEVINTIEQKFIDKEVNIHCLDNYIALACLEEVIYKFINEWEHSIIMDFDSKNTSRIPIKHIAYHQRSTFDDPSAELELNNETDILFDIYRKLNNME